MPSGIVAMQSWLLEQNLLTAAAEAEGPSAEDEKKELTQEPAWSKPVAYFQSEGGGAHLGVIPSERDPTRFVSIRDIDPSKNIVAEDGGRGRCKKIDAFDSVLGMEKSQIIDLARLDVFDHVTLLRFEAAPGTCKIEFSLENIRDRAYLYAETGLLKTFDRSGSNGETKRKT